MMAQQTDKLQRYRAQFHEVDRRIAAVMGRWSMPVLRASVGIVFIWFGALKLFDISPAADLVAETVYLVPPERFVPVLGVWEILIGICLLYRPLIRVGIRGGARVAHAPSDRPRAPAHPPVHFHHG